jgi:hypothetical protein
MTYYREVVLTGKAGFKFLEPAKEFNEWGLRFPADRRPYRSIYALPEFL